MMPLPAGKNSKGPVPKFFNGSLVAFASSGGLGDSLLEELHDILRQVEVREDARVVGDVNCSWRAS